MAPEEKISLLVLRGISTLKSLIETFENGIETEEESIALASSHLERFRLWVGSLGAHRESGSRSLEYKLRDASLIRKHIVTLLQDLCSSVDQGMTQSDRNFLPLPVWYLEGATDAIQKRKLLKALNHSLTLTMGPKSIVRDFDGWDLS